MRQARLRTVFAIARLRDMQCPGQRCQNTSAASACHTAAVGVTRCQLELFSIKRSSTFQ